MSKTVECKNCACYKAFYRKGIADFWAERQGLCSEFPQNIVKENDTCRRRKPCKRPEVTPEALDSVIDDIKVLLKLYKKDNFTF